ncbi:MAG: sialate O-acetylesterase [Paenibacillaceae bacterium]|jgi:sialate O-acetylesterase|nr:sialate O-acetylesterase [Paenibacillaceae bacterium]
MQASDFQLDPMFGDHMVLQRHKSIRVWGHGGNGSPVQVSVAGVQAETTVQDGCWYLELPALEAGGPHTLIAESGHTSIILRDILIGDVWLAGGQSNMQFALKEADGGLDMALTTLPSMRFFTIPQISWEDPDNLQTGSWKTCAREDAPNFSAVAFYFARKMLANQPDVPIGIIGCYWGGTSAACWIAEQDILDAPELHIYRDEFLETIRDFDWEAYNKKEQEFNAAMDEYNRRFAETKGKDPGTNPWPPPLSPRHFLRPWGLYHSMLQKAVPYGLKGFLYYQGEEDTKRPHLYEKLLTILIRRWRQDWQNEQLPFLFVQLPGYGCQGRPNDEEWALLREAQSKVADQVPDAALAVSIDCGDPRNIHPTNKQPVGERLALLALEQVYGFEVQGESPVLAEAVVQDGIVSLSFRHSNGGLVMGSPGPEEAGLRGFELAGRDGVYVAASSALGKDGKILVWSEQVPSPQYVRYAWANYPKASLYNGCGLPASPFRKKLGGEADE